MEPDIDRDISKAQTRALQQQNAALLRQNELLKQQLAQVKNRHAQTQKELSGYKNIVIKNSSDSQVLQMQHQRIFQLETQLEVVQNKYLKMVKSGGSNQMTDHAIKCKEYQRKLKDNQNQYIKQTAALRSKLAKQSAIEIVQNKRMVTSPNTIKKSSLGVGKFV